MGKAQSKRSVDITTEVNKEGNAVDEGTGKMGKIEDVDQLKPQLNGDANHKEGDAGEEKQASKDEAENEKDSATEKGDQSVAVEAVENGGAGDASAVSPTTEEKTPESAENGAEAENVNDTTATTLNESKEVVEGGDDANAASTPATDSAKKVKKEKSKKRFLSFRSFSFSKKDKQKPAKKDEEKAAVTNGDCEKVPEETTEEATPAAEQNGVADDAKTAEAAQPTTNGVSDEKKAGDAAADGAKAAETPAVQPASILAAAADAVAAPIAAAAEEASKAVEEIKQVAVETVEEAIVAASKSVDEKINVAVAKPEVNAVNDLVREPIETSETIEQSSENAIVVETTISDTNPDTSIAGLGDCTNNTNNNTPLPNPPPLPECPPPSQVSVFAETAMSSAVEAEATALPAPELPQSIPIIETIVIPSDSASVSASTKIELTNDDTTVVDDSSAVAAVQDVIEKLVEDVHVTEIEQSAIVADDTVETQLDQKVADSLPKPEEIAETIAILDSVNDAEIKAPEEITEISVDISSPLPQNSLESLPSPQSLSNVSPPSEIEENTTTELANEDASLVLPPPPPPVIDEELVDESATETPLAQESVTELASTENEITNGSELPPPPPLAVNADESESVPENNVHEPVKSNGNGELNTNGDSELLDALATNGCHLNGNSKNDGAVIIDKENGIGKDNSITEKLNGDAEHKTIEEIATSPEKLEKLAAANPPPSTEVVAAE